MRREGEKGPLKIWHGASRELNPALTALTSMAHLAAFKLL